MKRQIWICLGLLLAPLAATAADGAAASSATPAPAAGQAAAQSEAAAPAEEKPASPWGFGLGYGVSTDLAEELQPRLLEHSMDASISYEWKNVVSLSTGLGYSFVTVGKSFSRYPEDSGLSYGSISASRELKKEPWHFLGAEHTPSMGLSVHLPLSETAQIEGYQGNAGLSLSMGSKFFDGLFSLSNGVSYSRTWSRFDFSPTTFEPNVESSYGYKAGIGFKIIGKLSAGAGFSMKRSVFTDGFKNLSFGNSQSLSYSIGKLSMSVSHSNGGHTDKEKVQLWFVDKYRRLVSFDLGMSF